MHTAQCCGTYWMWLNFAQFSTFQIGWNYKFIQKQIRNIDEWPATTYYSFKIEKSFLPIKPELNQMKCNAHCAQFNKYWKIIPGEILRIFYISSNFGWQMASIQIEFESQWKYVKIELVVMIWRSFPKVELFKCPRVWHNSDTEFSSGIYWNMWLPFNFNKFHKRKEWILFSIR